jgi:hypothetical protein
VAVDANERFGPDNQPNQGRPDQDQDQDQAIAWPDGTPVTESERRAPDDARQLGHELRRLRREARWAGRRRSVALARRTLLSPRGIVAVLLIAALAASATVMALPLVR